ncbi:hypothetical protein [Streptomyces lydicus]|uniref:hypothetical protein n=1 Tax=Streptomyces lydicus TaxID=47763 RepID=UPI0036E3A33D
MSEARDPWRPTEHGANIGHSSAWAAHRKVALDLHRMLNAEEAAFRLVCDAYEALRLDEGNPVPRGWTYEVQRGTPRG